MSRLVVGLGNGICARETRHSLGLWLVEEAVSTHPHCRWQLHPSLFAWVARVRTPDRTTLVIWPFLPYNLVGMCVARACARFHIAAADVTLVHDDLELPVGTLRFSAGGSARGNNGVKSTIGALGTADFRRLQVGIGRPLSRAPQEVIGYVMSSGLEERKLLRNAETFPSILKELLQ